MLISFCPILGHGGTSGNLGGGGASGRRPPTDYPPHIQQLLDQDRHSYDHRSPLRRPVYRKVMVGGGGPPMGYDGGPLPVNLHPGK